MATESTQLPATFRSTHVAFNVTTSAHAERLTPDEAKAMLVAREAGVELWTGSSGPAVWPDRIDDIYHVPNGWYVYSHPGEAYGYTVFIDSSWKAENPHYGKPPPEIISIPLTKRD